jgi:hypothetical protein
MGDSWRLSPKLTVDLGLRYEYLAPFRDINDQSVNITDLDSPNPILVRASNQGENLDPYGGQAVRFTRATLVRDGRLGPGLVQPDRNNWAPRGPRLQRLAEHGRARRLRHLLQHD